jgi:hypothetical protein
MSIITSNASPNMKLLGAYCGNSVSPSSNIIYSYAAALEGAGALPLGAFAIGAWSVWPVRKVSKFGGFSVIRVVGHCPWFLR